MGRKLDADDLVGAQEIAARLGLRRANTVHSWRRRYDDFPQPAVVLAMGLVWSWAEIEDWAQRTGRDGA